MPSIYLLFYVILCVSNINKTGGGLIPNTGDVNQGTTAEVSTDLVSTEPLGDHATDDGISVVLLYEHTQNKTKITNSSRAKQPSYSFLKSETKDQSNGFTDTTTNKDGKSVFFVKAVRSFDCLLF